ncbi:MAG: hypothetical protein KGR99_02920, partial [Betaproteobacteria bacterium]|nr:hypothetical protein [Betaproteobacteria bacterium]
MPELRNAGAPCFVSQGCDPDSLELLEAHGSEALGEPFAFELTLASPSPELDLHALLRSPACLRLRHLHPELPDLPYHGMLERFEQLHSTPSHTLYRARLVP